MEVRTQIHHFFYALLAYPRAWRFMLQHRLWEGLREYGWVARLLVGAGILASIYLVSETIDWYASHADAPLYGLALGEDNLIGNFYEDVAESATDGGINWLILILLEVVIYHFMRRSLAIIINKDVRDATTFKPFLDAQVRMILVSFMSFGLQETVIGVAGGLTPDSLEGLLTVLVTSFFLGFAIADNYNEQFDLTIPQSIRQLWNGYWGICLGLGLPLYAMLQIPLLGAVAGPLAASVTAAIVLREKSDLHIIGYQMSEKEKKKAERKRAKKARKA